MEQEKLVYDKLNELGIQVQVVEHEPAVTIELADKFIEGIEGVRTKTMFLCDKKKRSFYLVITDEAKRIDLNALKDIVGVKQVRMASEESLYEKLMLPPGVVSPFGLLNNSDKDVKVFIDKEIAGEERMSFHPNTNEKTVFIKTGDLFDFLNKIGYPPSIIEL